METPLVALKEELAVLLVSSFVQANSLPNGFVPHFEVAAICFTSISFSCHCTNTPEPPDFE